MKLISCCALALLVVAGCGKPPEVAGKWIGSCQLMPQAPGDVTQLKVWFDADIEMTLVRVETSINGTVKMAITADGTFNGAPVKKMRLSDNTLPINLGVVANDRVSLSGQEAYTKYKFDGVAKGSEITGTFQYILLNLPEGQNVMSGTLTLRRAP